MPRGQNLGWEPVGKWTKPSLVLISESNYSDAHLFPWTYHHLGIGKLVGMPVAGTGTADLEDQRDMAVQSLAAAVQVQLANIRFFTQRGIYLRRILEQGTPKQIFGAPRDPRTRAFLQRVRSVGAGALR